MTKYRLTSGLMSAIVATVVSTAPVHAQDLDIVTSMPSLGFPFFVHMQNELNAEAETLGGITMINQDGQNSAPKQTAELEAAIHVRGNRAEITLGEDQSILVQGARLNLTEDDFIF